MASDKNYTIHDVAREAGVSVKTVSRVLNNDQTVRAYNIDKVQQVINRLNYKPDLNARRLRSKQSYLIALLYTEYPGNSYSNLITSGAIDVCDQLGYDLLVRPFRNKADKQVEQLIRHVAERSNPDGFLVIPPMSDTDSLLATIKEYNKPVVRIAPLKNQSSNAVYCDEISATILAINHLISLGHTRIGILNYLVGHAAGEWRYQGYQQALQQARIKLDPDLVLQQVYQVNTFENGIRNMLSMTNRPTAIFTVNDFMATVVYRVAAQLQIRIPYDLSVVGFDDDPLSSHLWPPLTTIKQPVHELGRAATELLINQCILNKPTQPQDPLLCELVIRSSSGPRNHNM